MSLLCQHGHEPEDLTGQRFGKLTVEKFSYRDPGSRRRYWLCKCDCGREKIIERSSLRGGTESCGCINKAILSNRNKKHGMTGTRVYRCWRSMCSRVNQKTHKDYEYYNKLGMDPRWLGFSNFYKDMGNAPSEAHTIDRKDNSRGYWPDNCRWATRKEQDYNRGLMKNNTSGYTGVCRKSSLQKWSVQIIRNGKKYYIGGFSSAFDASIARDIKLAEIQEKENAKCL